MLNQCVLVGRLTKDIENGIVNVSIPRNYKNENGEYENDFISCHISEKVETNAIEYCKKNDIVGIKGSIHSKDGEIYIQVEKITFLSSKKITEEEE